MSDPVGALPLVDHHCHGVRRGPLDRPAFEADLTEAGGPGRWHGSLFDTHAGLAVRRWCAPVLDLEAHCSPDEYLARRAELGPEEVNRRLIGAAGIGDFLVDTGFEPDALTSPGELAAFGGGRGHEIVRLEQVAESVRAADDFTPESYADAFGAALTARAADAVGFKSIAAYRIGLDLDPARPSERAVARAAAAWADGDRLADPTLIRHGIWTALEHGRPLQFHVGYGDNDVELARCDPLLLMPLLRATAPLDVPIMLLHNYPFHRHAGYLAQVFDHVFVDVGLAVQNVGPRTGALLAELLELAPFGSVLFSTDAFALPELYPVSATLFRRALAGLLLDGVREQTWTAADAERFAAMITGDNARRAYGLDAR